MIRKRQIEELKPKTEQEFYDELRNGVIEEVAKEIEKMKGFGQDTISSFTIYIRNMKCGG
jgi:septin family protein